MSFLEKYALLIKIALLVSLIVLAGYLWKSHNKEQQEIGYRRAVAEYKAQLVEAKEQAQIKDDQHKKDLKEAQDGRAKAEQEISRNRNSALLAEQRLRDATSEFGKRLSSASLEASRRAAEAAAGLLQECSGRYRQVAEAADGHLADLEQCERAWPE